MAGLGSWFDKITTKKKDISTTDKAAALQKFRKKLATAISSENTTAIDDVLKILKANKVELKDLTVARENVIRKYTDALAKSINKSNADIYYSSVSFYKDLCSKLGITNKDIQDLAKTDSIVQNNLKEAANKVVEQDASGKFIRTATPIRQDLKDLGLDDIIKNQLPDDASKTEFDNFMKEKPVSPGKQYVAKVINEHTKSEIVAVIDENPKPDSKGRYWAKTVDGRGVEIANPSGAERLHSVVENNGQGKTYYYTKNGEVFDENLNQKKGISYNSNTKKFEQAQGASLTKEQKAELKSINKNTKGVEPNQNDAEITTKEFIEGNKQVATDKYNEIVKDLKKLSTAEDIPIGSGSLGERIQNMSSDELEKLSKEDPNAFDRIKSDKNLSKTISNTLETRGNQGDKVAERLYKEQFTERNTLGKAWDASGKAWDATKRLANKDVKIPETLAKAWTGASTIGKTGAGAFGLALTQPFAEFASDKVKEYTKNWDPLLSDIATIGTGQTIANIPYGMEKTIVDALASKAEGTTENSAKTLWNTIKGSTPATFTKNLGVAALKSAGGVIANQATNAFLNNFSPFQDSEIENSLTDATKTNLARDTIANYAGNYVMMNPVSAAVLTALEAFDSKENNDLEEFLNKHTARTHIYKLRDNSGNRLENPQYIGYVDYSDPQNMELNVLNSNISEEEKTNALNSFKYQTGDNIEGFNSKISSRYSLVSDDTLKRKITQDKKGANGLELFYQSEKDNPFTFSRLWDNTKQFGRNAVREVINNSPYLIPFFGNAVPEYDEKDYANYYSDGNPLVTKKLRDSQRKEVIMKEFAQNLKSVRNAIDTGNVKATKTNYRLLKGLEDNNEYKDLYKNLTNEVKDYLTNIAKVNVDELEALSWKDYEKQQKEAELQKALQQNQAVNNPSVQATGTSIKMLPVDQATGNAPVEDVSNSTQRGTIKPSEQSINIVDMIKGVMEQSKAINEALRQTGIWDK